MIVADTHALIWWMEGDQRLSAVAASAMRTEEFILIPAISLWEIALLTAKGRITLSAPVGYFLRTLLEGEGFEVAPLTVEIAVRASQLGDSIGRDPADRLIAATAIEFDAPLLTVDQRMHAFGDGLRTLW